MIAVYIYSRPGNTVFSFDSSLLFTQFVEFCERKYLFDIDVYYIIRVACVHIECRFFIVKKISEFKNVLCLNKAKNCCAGQTNIFCVPNMLFRKECRKNYHVYN